MDRGGFSALHCSGLMAKITSNSMSEKTDSSDSPVCVVLEIHLHVIDIKRKKQNRNRER